MPSTADYAAIAAHERRIQDMAEAELRRLYDRPSDHAGPAHGVDPAREAVAAELDRLMGGAGYDATTSTSTTTTTTAPAADEYEQVQTLIRGAQARAAGAPTPASREAVAAELDRLMGVDEDDDDAPVGGSVRVGPPAGADAVADELDRLMGGC